MGFFPHPPKSFKALKGEILQVLIKMNDFLNDHIKMSYHISLTKLAKMRKIETLSVGQSSGEWMLRAAQRSINWYIYRGQSGSTYQNLKVIYLSP